MSKYYPLRDYLLTLKQSRCRMTFAEIEVVLGQSLPASARKYPAWWSNEIRGRHVQKQGWMDAGYRTVQLDLAGETVSFEQAG